MLIEMCILLSRGAFCPREVRLEVPARVQSARLGARGGADRPESGVIAAAAIRAGARVGPPGGPRRRGLSKSATKTPIPLKHRKRIVDIPRFHPRPIPVRGVFVADLDTPPPRTAPGAPCAPPRTHSSRTAAPIRALSRRF